MLIVPICVLMAGIIFILIGLLVFKMMSEYNPENKYWFAIPAALLVFGLFISIVAIVGGIGNIIRGYK